MDELMFTTNSYLCYEPIMSSAVNLKTRPKNKLMILQASYHAKFLVSRQVNTQEYMNPSLPNTSQNVQCAKTTYPSTKGKSLILAATKHVNVNSTMNQGSNIQLSTIYTDYALIELPLN